MNIKTLPNGNLEMTATDAEQALLKRWKRKQLSTTEFKFIRVFLAPLGYRWIRPEDCGALTGATLIRKGADVWGDMNYQVRSFIQDLAEGNAVTWTKG